VRTVPGQPTGADEAFAALGEAMGRFPVALRLRPARHHRRLCLNTIETLHEQTRRLSDTSPSGERADDSGGEPRPGIDR
jgi:Ser/Thr protein kinase RdoA (MazF antagonist)